MTYGKEYPLSVVRTAYGYTLNGHSPKNSLATAVTIYAAKKWDNPLKCEAFTVAVDEYLRTVHVYEVKTETEAGLLCLLSLVQTKGIKVSNLALNDLIARYAENCLLECVWENVSSRNQTVGFYVHLNRYVAVVTLKYEAETLSTELDNQMQNVADYLARSAVCYYPAYSEVKDLQKKVVPKTADVNADNVRLFQEWFQQRRLNMLPWRPPYTDDAVVSVNRYLEQLNEQLGIRMQMSDIRVFGF